MSIGNAGIRTTAHGGQRASRTLPTATRPQISLVIPAHNEEAVIAKTLQSYTGLLERRSTSYEILVVLNGCQDRTLEHVTALQASCPSLGWALLAEAGKGRAVKLGFQLAHGDWVGFVDADGQISPEEFEKLLLVLERMPEVDGVIASKYREPAFHREAVTSPLRDLAGRTFSQLVRSVLGLPYRDTQCGAKVFRRQALQDVLGDLKLEGWTFDVELLLHLHRQRKRIAEVPVVLRSGDRPSQLRTLQVAPRMFRDVLELRKRLRRLPSPDPPEEPSVGRRLGEILCKLGVLGAQEIERALARQRRERRRLGEILVQMGFITPEEVQLALALQRV